MESCETKCKEVPPTEDDKKIFNQILSTFKFFKREHPEWSLYFNEKLNFYFEYPSSFYLKTISDEIGRLLEISNNPLFGESETAYVVNVYVGTKSLFLERLGIGQDIESPTETHIKILDRDLNFNFLNQKFNGQLRGMFLGDPPWGYYEIYFPNPNRNLDGISFAIRIHQSDNPGYGGNYEYRNVSKQILSTFRFID